MEIFACLMLYFLLGGLTFGMLNRFLDSQLHEDPQITFFGIFLWPVTLLILVAVIGFKLSLIKSKDR